MCRATKVNIANLLLLLCLVVVGVIIPIAAQVQPKFDPARFEADLRQFITTEASLTPTEAQRFFPLYHEMREKERTFFGADRRYRCVDPNNDKMCEEVILLHDENDIQMKQIQKEYHQRFLQVLPASKVFKVIKAEDRFHRQMFQRAAKHDRKRK